ncbi:hypothetical protein [Thermomonospora amylolytica]|uniref:hypothetical protein n=1 Tax=Thermomonospora amylolytica TaxID=1411117 RepID=UPI0013006B79|nr:hypothetical protein [Thermomonospora amylolytica]
MKIARLAAIAALIMIPFTGLGLACSYPLVALHTHLAGEDVVVRVGECEFRGRRSSCEATWRDGSGRLRHGTVGAAHSDDEGRDVIMRAGPAGRLQERNLGFFWVMMVFPALFYGSIVAVPAWLLVVSRRSAAAARELLTRPGALLVGRGRIRHADGRVMASLRKAEAPPGYTPVSLPGAKSRKKTSSILDAATSLASNPTRDERFRAVVTPEGRKMFLIDRRPGGSTLPETWLVDPAGTPRGVVRRLQDHPFRAQMMDARGTRVGSIKMAPGSEKALRPTSFVIRDGSGRHVATMTPAGLRNLACHVEPDADPLVRDLVLVLALDLGRLTR